MIKSFAHKGLAQLWETGVSGKVDAKLQSRVLERLDAMDAASKVTDLMVPGFDFHPLKGFKPTRYTLHVNGPWCVTFEFKDGDAFKVDLENYH